MSESNRSRDIALSFFMRTTGNLQIINYARDIHITLA